MLVDVVMPQLGESVVEGVVTKWLVKAGDAVAKDQPLVEISTDKVDAEIPSPVAGVVAEILVKEREVVPINVPIARIETEKGKAAAPAPAERAPWDEETEGIPGAMARKTGPPIPPPPREAPQAAPRPREAPPAAERPGTRVTPVVARMAAEYALDLSKIRGTGDGGRVTKRDVEDHLAGKGAPPPPSPREARIAPPGPSAPSGVSEAPEGKPAAAPGLPEDRLVPFTPIRKRIAEHMVASKRTSPHVHTFAEVDMGRVAAIREAAKAKGVQLTYLPFVVHAAVRALKEFPVLNASVEGDATRFHAAIHMGIAVDTDRGLLVPVVRNAGDKSFLELARAAEELGARAKAHKVLPDDLAGGTFSITNPGPKGNLFGTPIINQPQVGILRLGQVVKRPVVVTREGEDAIVVRPVMILCLGYDHRIVDGVAGNSFLFRVRELLESGEFPI